MRNRDLPRTSAARGRAARLILITGTWAGIVLFLAEWPFAMVSAVLVAAIVASVAVLLRRHT